MARQLLIGAPHAMWHCKSLIFLRQKSRMIRPEILSKGQNGRPVFSSQ